MDKKLIIPLLSLISSISNAGWFGKDEPPAEFLKLKVGVLTHYGQVEEYPCPLEQLAKKMTEAGKTDWTKESESRWVLRVKMADAATGTTQTSSFVFDSKNEKKLAGIVRYVDNGNEVTSTYLSSAVSPLVRALCVKN